MSDCIIHGDEPAYGGDLHGIDFQCTCEKPASARPIDIATLLLGKQVKVKLSDAALRGLREAFAIVAERLCTLLDRLPVTRDWYTCRWLVQPFWDWHHQQEKRHGSS